MGLPMAENLRASGLDVIGYDINKSARDTFSGVSFDEVKKALSHAETVITMLPSGKEVKKILFTLKISIQYQINYLLILDFTILYIMKILSYIIPFSHELA